MEAYRDFIINENPEPLAHPRYAFTFRHFNYDGAEDSGDHRAGYAATIHDCKADIDEMIEQLEVM